MLIRHNNQCFLQEIRPKLANHFFLKSILKVINMEVFLAQGIKFYLSLMDSMKAASRVLQQRPSFKRNSSAKILHRPTSKLFPSNRMTFLMTKTNSTNSQGCKIPSWTAASTKPLFHQFKKTFYLIRPKILTGVPNWKISSYRSLWSYLRKIQSDNRLRR